MLGPVGRGSVISEQLSRAAQRVALEVEGFIFAGDRIAIEARDQSCRIVMPQRLSAQIQLLCLIVIWMNQINNQAVFRRITVNKLFKLDLEV